VTPLGTGILLRTMVEQDFLDALAEAALVKVQDVALSSSFAGGVAAGAGTATTSAGKAIAKKPRNEGVNNMIISE